MQHIHEVSRLRLTSMMRLTRKLAVLSTLFLGAGCRRAYVVPETPMPPDTVLLSAMMRQLSAQPGFTDKLVHEIDQGGKKGPALLTPKLVDELRKRILGSDWQGLDRFPGWTMREINPTVRVVGHLAGKDQKLEAASAVHPGAPLSAVQASQYLDLGPYGLNEAETISLDHPSTLPPFNADGIVTSLGGGVTRGDGPNDLAPEHAASQRLVDVLDVWNGEIRAINPESSVVPNNGSGAGSPLNTIETSRRAPMLAADRQARHGLEAPWLVGKSGKEYRATMGDKAVIGLFGIGLEEAYRWKDSVTSNAEIRIWALDAVANGMRPWFTKFSATLHDQRWLGEIEDIYVWTEKNQRYLAGRKPMARVAMVYSQQTSWYYGGRAEDYALGWYQALVESRIPFEMVHDRLLDAEHLAGFKTLILPNVACLSEAQCEQLRGFVAKGGSVIATHETSLYDEVGTRRKSFGLADVFGVDWAGKVQGPMLNSYIRLEHEALPGSAWFAGLEDAPRIINGVTRLDVTPREKFAETPFTLIPSYPDLPMEKVYPRVAKTDISCLYAREAGGRVAYFPFDLDRTFWEVLCGDHLKMMRNALAWAHNEAAPVEVDGPGLLDVTAWRNANAITIHLVNLTNPMAMKGPYRDFFPVGPHTVRVRMPAGVQAKRARLLAADKEIALERTGGGVSVTVPSIRDHEVMAIEI